MYICKCIYSYRNRAKRTETTNTLAHNLLWYALRMECWTWIMAVWGTPCHVKIFYWYKTFINRIKINCIAFGIWSNRPIDRFNWSNPIYPLSWPNWSCACNYMANELHLRCAHNIQRVVEPIHNQMFRISGWIFRVDFRFGALLVFFGSPQFKRTTVSTKEPPTKPTWIAKPSNHLAFYRWVNHSFEWHRLKPQHYTQQYSIHVYIFGRRILTLLFNSHWK